jgi:hypothetical protein
LEEIEASKIKQQIENRPEEVEAIKKAMWAFPDLFFIKKI